MATKHKSKAGGAVYGRPLLFLRSALVERRVVCDDLFSAAARVKRGFRNA